MKDKDIINSWDCESDGTPIAYIEQSTGDSYHPTVPCPYQPGDILYVRETFYKDAGRYMYRANYSDNEKFYRDGKEVSIKWHPSIHMPKEAARIFLRVTDVQVERLKDMTANQAMDEGFMDWNDAVRVWDSTIKKADLPLYGWDANPWVWVITFERDKKPEGWCK